MLICLHQPCSKNSTPLLGDMPPSCVVGQSRQRPQDIAIAVLIDELVERFGLQATTQAPGGVNRLPAS
jgi:hypothetical protein